MGSKSFRDLTTAIRQQRQTKVARVRRQQANPNRRAGNYDPVSGIAAGLAVPWFHASKNRSIC